MNELAKSLQKPFAPEDIEWRPQAWGKQNSGQYWVQVLAYVTNRAIMNRLDEVCGPERWKNEFRDWHNGSQLCCISIFLTVISENEWVSKWDGAEQTHIESIKGGLSDSMKRAAVQWGIGRYLYKLDRNLAITSVDRKPKEQGWHYFSADGENGKNCKKGERHTFYWRTPALPKWALPEDHQEPVKAERQNSVLRRHDLLILSSEDYPEGSKERVLAQLIESCSSMDELDGAWGAATSGIRREIGDDFLQQQKERVEVFA